MCRGTNTMQRVASGRGRCCCEPTQKRTSNATFSGFMPTSARSLATVQPMLDSGGLKDMPACGGLSILWSRLGAFDDAFELMKVDKARGRHPLLKLYEASLNVTIRLRVTEDTDQLVLDKFGFAEVIRASAIASAAESFFIFVQRVADL